MWETASDRVIRIEVCILTWIEVHHVLRLFPHLETLEAGRAAAEYTQDLHTHTHTHTHDTPSDTRDVWKHATAAVEIQFRLLLFIAPTESLFCIAMSQNVDKHNKTSLLT